MATILQSGTSDISLHIDDYEFQTALAEESAIWERIANQDLVQSSGTNTRWDEYYSEGGHLILLGNGFDQDDGIATVTSFSYSDPLGAAFEFTGHFDVDLYWEQFLGGSLNSFWLDTPNISVVLEGSLYLDGMEDFYGDVSFLQVEALGAAVTLSGDLYIAGDGSVTGELAQIRFDSGNGEFVEFQNFNLSYPDLAGYGTFQQLYVQMVAGDDVFYGSPVSDTFNDGPGNDTLFGGDGTDVVLTDGIVSQYQISQSSGDAIMTGPEGTDMLSSVEYVRFGSGAYTTDVPLWDAVTGNPLHLAEQITDLYVAYFNRGPDTEGLDYWFQEIYTGAKGLRTIAEDFAWSDEYQAMYPGWLTNDQFVEQIYQNLFDRSPDLGGWDYWTNRLDTGSVQRSGFILDVIEGAYAPTSGPEDRTLIDNKHDVSLYYAGQMVTNPQEGFDFAIVDLLNLVTGDIGTIAAAENVIDYAFDNPITLTGVMTNEALFDSLWTSA